MYIWRFVNRNTKYRQFVARASFGLVIYEKKEKYITLLTTNQIGKKLYRAGLESTTLEDACW